MGSSKFGVILTCVGFCWRRQISQLAIEVVEDCIEPTITSWAILNFSIMNLTMVIISINKLTILIFNILLFDPNKFNHNQ